MRKIQASVNESCTAFDLKLREFFYEKMNTDQEILENELRMLKLSLSTQYIKNQIQKVSKMKINRKEAEVAKKLDSLKSEKSTFVAEIPESKVCTYYFSIKERD